MKVIALDPGKVTSFAIFDSLSPQAINIGELTLIGSGRLIRPCPLHLGDLLDSVDQAIVEEVGARPAQGVSSVFTFGMCLGTVLGAIGTKAKPLAMVSPREWKKSARIGVMDREEAKTLARSFAKELWPQHAKIFDVKKNHGVAEAALMTRWYFHAGPGRFAGMAQV